MDNEHAKLILSAYRPDDSDAADPEFAEALALAERDPELALWFAESRAFDQRMSGSLRSVRPPSDLKASILAAKKTTRFPAPRTWWRHPAWLAAAAALVLFGGLASHLFRAGPVPMKIAAVTSEIARLQIENSIALGELTSDHAQARRWLKEHDGPGGFLIPAGLSSKPSIGCQVLNIQGNKVALVCFKTGEDQVVHLLVVDRRRLADPPAVGKPLFLQEGEIAFVTWSDDSRTYVMSGRASSESLRQWL